jgi:hypothetical protein
MKASLEALDFKDSRKKVDLIHKTLYSFSNNNLHLLLRDSPAFRFILTEIIKNKNEIFSIFTDPEIPSD